VRVLYVNHTIQKSGAGISLSTLLRRLPANIDRSFLLPKRSEIDAMLGAIPERTFRERFLCQFMTTLYTPQYPPALFAWHLVKMPMAVARVRQLVRRWRIDLVHVNETTLVAYALGARLAGVPAVMHARTAIAPRPFERALLSKFGRMERACIACIDAEVRDSLPEDGRRIARVIHNPIDLGRAPSAAEIAAMRQTWGCGTEHVVIGQVASLHRQKGIWLILDLAEQLCGEHPALRIVLVGDTSPQAGEGPQLRAAIEQRGLAGRVVLPGYDSRLALTYGALDVALCLFGGELGGVGRAAYEAALAGKPLVATVPDPRRAETIEHGVSGLLFTHDDRAGIADALRRLIADSASRASLGESARAAIGPRHAPAAIAQKVGALYEELIGTRELQSAPALSSPSASS
jgi:glycosyltransferase involved in cell wall biosynthesis